MTTRTVNGEQQQQRRQPHYASGRPHRPYSSSYYEGAGGGGGGSASLKGCCCCLFLLLTFLALLAVAVVLVVVLVVKPRKPQFDLQQVSVQYLLVASPSSSSSSSSSSSPSDSSSAYLSLNITLLFTAENPNKVGIRYGPTAFDVMYRGVPLGVAAVPGFEQPAHSTRLVQTRFSVDRFNVLQSDALDLLRDAPQRPRRPPPHRRRRRQHPPPRIHLPQSPGMYNVSVDCAIAISPSRQSLTYKQCGVDGVNL
ncbi:hypothetical protein ACMD2_25778 [Ananas comosus]|uniref:Late embryogenesis abundant protein LEA-2 subgroup domain-containing protein n=1 Tax=Ananas comosus TaxID=4615 RepID=A0A199VGT6_ANACO|nr:hypothetical protein ACMD2_25778 [Ananas comosus]